MVTCCIVAVSQQDVDAFRPALILLTMVVLQTDGMRCEQSIERAIRNAVVMMQSSDNNVQYAMAAL